MKIDPRIILTVLLLQIGVCRSEHHAHDDKSTQESLAETQPPMSFLCSTEKKAEFLAKAKDCLSSPPSDALFLACPKAYLTNYARCNKGCDTATKAVWNSGGAEYCFKTPKTVSDMTFCYNAHRELFPDCDPYSGPEQMPTSTKTCSAERKKEYQDSLPSCIDKVKQAADYSHYGNCIYEKTMQFEGCNLECNSAEKQTLWSINQYIATFQGDDNVVHAMAASRFAFPKCAESWSLRGAGERKIIQNDGTQICIYADNSITVKPQGEYCFVSDIPPPPKPAPTPPPAPTLPPTPTPSNSSQTGTGTGPTSTSGECTTMFTKIDACDTSNVVKFHACTTKVLKGYSGCDGCSEKVTSNFSTWSGQLSGFITLVSRKDWYYGLYKIIETKLKEVTVQFPQCTLSRIPSFNMPTL